MSKEIYKIRVTKPGNVVIYYPGSADDKKAKKRLSWISYINPNGTLESDYPSNKYRLISSSGNLKWDEDGVITKFIDRNGEKTIDGHLK
jgi:hypothetical protein